MKKLFGLVTFCAAWQLAAVISPQTWTLGWSQDNAPSDELIYKVYTSPDPGLPFSQWTLFRIVPGTNYSTVLNGLIPAQMYFHVTASNAWGESIEATNRIGLPAPAVDPKKATLNRGP